MGLIEEVREQPAVAERMLLDEARHIREIALAVVARRPEFVVIAARGSSDNAAIHAQYAFGTVNRLPVALAAPSIVSLYGVEPDVRRGLVIGISQSGVSPDVCETIEAARRQGAPTIAITNDPSSRLATGAEHVIDLHAGPELAVAATKTYTAELLAVTLLSLAMAEHRPVRPEDLARLPEAMAHALDHESEGGAEAAAAALKEVVACIVLGRGFGYATAREWALKLKEMALVMADPYSSADFQHGPLALIGRETPVFVVAPTGLAAGDVGTLATRLRDDLGAELLVLSDDLVTRQLGRRSLAVPTVPELLSPIVSILPAQLFALHLARARGIDPERPRHLRKVTSTR